MDTLEHFMAIRYKTTTLNGKPILTHRKVWINEYGHIPQDRIIHHKNGDRFDNRVENLEPMTRAEHAKHHSSGRAAWNRGHKYGNTEAYKRSNKVRKENYVRLCAEVYEKWNAGTTQNSLAEEYGVSRRQICERLRYYRANHNLPNGRRANDQTKD
jgi:hypothetical protein